MWLFLVLLIVPCFTSADPDPEKCFNDAAAEYITCKRIHEDHMPAIVKQKARVISRCLLPKN